MAQNNSWNFGSTSGTGSSNSNEPANVEKPQQTVTPSATQSSTTTPPPPTSTPATGTSTGFSIIDRVKAIMFNPKGEWAVIEAESAPQTKVLPYVLTIALIPAVAYFVGYWWQIHSYAGSLGHSFMALAPGIIAAVAQFATMLGGIYLSAAIINALADQFGSQKDLNRSFALVAYSYTPLCVAGIVYLWSPLAFIIPLAGLYGLYILFLGIEPQLKPAAEKKTTGIVIALIVTLVVYQILSRILLVIISEVCQSILMEQVKSGF
ncbi:MAG: YIP1 family protein [Candidatus Symbiothrix sp.]|jgi:hypothetical protein|nr:YIP1 family protein [Candidatus Symbiothrix sp.]